MPQTPQPYLTTTPWINFTSRENKRDAALSTCPSAKCRRAKACVDAHDNIYCQRSHESVIAVRARRKPAPKAPKLIIKTAKQAQAKQAELELLLDHVRARDAELTARWKSGAFENLYGKYKPGGVLKHPPYRQYTD